MKSFHLSAMCSLLLKLAKYTLSSVLYYIVIAFQRIWRRKWSFPSEDLCDVLLRIRVRQVNIIICGSLV